MSADEAAAGSTVSVVALDGIPEIRIGDDLAAIIVGAIEGTAGVLPLTERDVLVVTQKVVSKAEGAIVDLTEVEPRREAVEFAKDGTAIRARSRWCCARRAASSGWRTA